MFKMIQIGVVILFAYFYQESGRAQLGDVVNQAVRSTFGEHFDDRWMNMASKDAEEINQATSTARDQADAEKIIKEYQSEEMSFVEKSWKFNDSKPRDYFRAHTAKSLEQLKIKFGVIPQRNFIERFIIWIDNISS